MLPPVPSNERERLAALQRYAVLDTLPEPAFDRLTGIASRLFSVPMVLVTLIDGRRQWFKARHGVGFQETARDISFCAVTVSQAAVLVVPDAAKDPRFANNPLVTGGPRIRFYAGAPLRTPTGFDVGSFAILDTQPRDLSPEQRGLLSDLAAVVVDELELRLRTSELAEQLHSNLASSERRLEALLGCTLGIAFELDASCTYLGVWTQNDALLVRPKQELIGKTIAEVMGEAGAPLTELVQRAHLSGRAESIEYLMDLKGLRKWFLVDAVPIPPAPGNSPTVGMLVREITTLKRTEEQLRRSTERFQLASRATKDAIWDWEFASDAVWWGEGYRALFGYTPAQIEPSLESWSSRLHPSDADRVLQGVKGLISSGRSSWVDEYRYRRADGSYAEVLDRGFVIHEHGIPVRMVGAMSDVTASKQGQRAQDAIRRVAEAGGAAGTLHELMASIHSIVRELLPADNFYIALHDERAGLIRFPYFVDEKDRAPEPKRLGTGLTEHVLRTGVSLLRCEADLKQMHLSGEVGAHGAQPVCWIGVPLSTGTQTMGVLALKSYSEAVHYAEPDKELLEIVSTQVARAIERRQLQEQLLVADRMVSMGTLAAGVAHEINNPLAFVQLNLEYAVEQLRALAARPELHEVTRALDDAMEGAARVRAIVRDLKVFSRPDATQIGVIDIRRVLDSSIQMAHNEIRHRARLVKSFGETPPVSGNEARLGQVFLNLLINAAHSITEGASDENEIAVSTKTDSSGQLVVTIRDTGAGMSPEVQRRIFDPFFTTKPVGIGTGLGLSVCHGIISALGGKIEVNSEPAKGTEFRVLLPPSEPAS